mmetsp:Transcript_41542/g.111366  ORF Transcript_41542/g.111366 Transcript_41542/m.111366 type:complete len:89 (+) Transcript_41542:272-538(+)
MVSDRRIKQTIRVELIRICNSKVEFFVYFCPKFQLVPLLVILTARDLRAIGRDARVEGIRGMDLVVTDVVERARACERVGGKSGGGEG